MAFTTDLDGNYTLNLSPGNYTLVYDFIGYKPIEVKNIVVKGSEIVLKNEILYAKQFSLDEEVALK